MKENATMVTNSYGDKIYYNAAVTLMDDDLREEVHSDLAPCTEQEFFDEYSRRHEERFGEAWLLDEPNPQY